MHERRRFTAAAAHGGSRTQMLTALMVSLLCVHALFLSFACYCALLPHVGPPGFFDLCIVDLYDSRVLDTRACSGGAFFARNGKFSLGATTIRRTKAYSGGMLAAVGLLEVRSELRRQMAVCARCRCRCRAAHRVRRMGYSNSFRFVVSLQPPLLAALPYSARGRVRHHFGELGGDGGRRRRRAVQLRLRPHRRNHVDQLHVHAWRSLGRNSARARERHEQRSAAQHSGLLMPFRGRRATRQSPSWGSLIFGLHRALRLASLRIFSVANLIFVFRRRRDLELLAAAASNSDSQPVVVHRHRRPQRRRRRSAAHRPSLTTRVRAQCNYA